MSTVDLWSCLALALLLGWVLWRGILFPPEKRAQDPGQSIILALILLTFAINVALDVRTDIAIDRWSASDWWRGGFTVMGVFLTGAALGVALGMWRQRKAASREPRQPIESNGAQA